MSATVHILPLLHEHPGRWWIRRWHWAIDIYTIDGPHDHVQGWTWTHAGALSALRRAAAHARARDASAALARRRPQDQLQRRWP